MNHIGISPRVHHKSHVTNEKKYKTHNGGFHRRNVQSTSAAAADPPTALVTPFLRLSSGSFSCSKTGEGKHCDRTIGSPRYHVCMLCLRSQTAAGWLQKPPAIGNHTLLSRYPKMGPHILRVVSITHRLYESISTGNACSRDHAISSSIVYT